MAMRVLVALSIGACPSQAGWKQPHHADSYRLYPELALAISVGLYPHTTFLLLQGLRLLPEEACGKHRMTQSFCLRTRNAVAVGVTADNTHRARMPYTTDTHAIQTTYVTVIMPVIRCRKLLMCGCTDQTKQPACWKRPLAELLELLRSASTCLLQVVEALSHFGSTYAPLKQ